jgi:molecular chaperone DnaK
VELRNQADGLAYSAEKLLVEHKDKIPEELKKEIEQRIADLRSTLQGQDFAAIRARYEELGQALQKVGTAVYSQAGAGPTGGPGPEGGPPPPPESGTVEGEFREI